jgi:antitoxin (DNA-binding transcriptional repressor) of toxin-antitoxin stability system
MKTTTIRQLKHDTTTVLGWVAEGESVEVRRHSDLVAVLSPPPRKRRVARPDFAARMMRIYGDKMLKATGTDLISESRGNS